MEKLGINIPNRLAPRRVHRSSGEKRGLGSRVEMELICSMRTVRPFNIHHAFITAETIRRRVARAPRCFSFLLVAVVPLSLPS